MKMAVVQLLALLTVAGLTAGRNLNVQNNLRYTVWVGIQGHAGKRTPDNGGFALNSGENRIVPVANDWGGKFWARTGCNFNVDGQGPCATGDCGDKLHCNGVGGVPPVTLADITLNGDGGNDLYDINLVDGFNVPMQVKPTRGGVSGYSCTTASCSKDLNLGCPVGLKVTNDGNVVACKSSCLASNTDEDCCRGRFNDPDDCSKSTSARYCESNCPEAYCYANGDANSTFTCQNTDYDIIFG